MSEREIFEAALGLTDPVERAAYLDRACGPDAALRNHLEGLLHAHGQLGAFLESPAPGLAAAGDMAVSEGPGSVVGPYRLLEQIGEGGFGVVFMAEQTEPVRRKVALKILKPGMDTRMVVARFEAERQALALMDHPHIARIFGGGATASGRPYFVMELVRGVPITEFTDRNRLGIRRRLDLFAEVCAAVQHAHTKGVIHRDLKPSNVLVTLHDDRAVVKVIDFGVAKALGHALTDKTLFTGFAQMIGTPLYMSPEQAQLSGLDVDTRSDVYALGVLLYELLTGATPFGQARLQAVGYDEMRRIIREEDPPRPSTRLSAVGLAGATVSANRSSDPRQLSRLLRGELDWIVMKALEKDRNRRYESASALAADVGRYLQGEPVLACPPSAAYRLRKFVGRNRGPVLACALVALALVGGIIGTTWGMLRATRAEADAVSEARQKHDALEDAGEKLFLALESQARAERASGRVGQRFAALRAIRQAARIRVTPELRTEATAALVLPDVEVAHEWEGWPEGTVGVAFDAVFERYARLDSRGGLTVCRLSGGREEVIRRLPRHGKPLFSTPVMSGDGRFVAYGHSRVSAGIMGAVRLWKLDGPAPEVVLDEPAGLSEFAIAFRRDSRQLAIGHADRSVSVYDLATGRRLWRLAVAAPPFHLAFHPRENRLAVSGGPAVQIFDTDTGKEVKALRHPAPVSWTQSVAWHPDGRRLAVGCDDLKIHVWDTETAAEVMAPWEERLLNGMHLNFNHAGDRLASVDWSGQTALWDSAGGRRLLLMPGYVGLQFSDDDCLLGPSRSGTRLQLWRLAGGRELRVLRRRNADRLEGIAHPVVDPDGRMLLAHSSGWLNFFDLAGCEELASVRMSRAEDFYPILFIPPHSGWPFQKGDGGWVTGGRSGLYFWPVRRDDARPGGLCVGPPVRVAPDLGSWVSNGASISADGGVIAVPLDNSTAVLHRDRPDRRVTLGPQYDVRCSAVSPDGRYVATGSHWEDGLAKSARIWDARSGRQVHELPVEGSTTVRFSPDGRWLMSRTGNVGNRLWEVGTWQEVRRFEYAGFAFSPDSRLLAVNDVFGVIRLVETATGREVARLTGPAPMWYHPECFTPDGTRLITTCSGHQALYVWDLRLIRRQLKELGLDWDWPEFGPEEEGARRAGPPPVVRVLGGELLAPGKGRADDGMVKPYRKLPFMIEGDR